MQAGLDEAVFFQVADLFNLEVDLIFYETTTASFHIDQEDDPDRHENATLRKFGHAKEGNWAPQVVVALSVTREGIPVRSWVFPGNTADVSTVKTIRADLKGWKLGRALFVADSGMNSEDNRTELARACGKYLLAREVTVGDGERRKRCIPCYNPKEAERQLKHR